MRSAPPGRHCDGNGLYLYVQKTGTRSWIQRLVVRGRKREFGQKRAGGRSAAHARSWLRSLELYAFSRIGNMPVSEVMSADVLEILTPIWHTKGPTARYVHHRIRAVLEWAIAMDWRTDNPCDRLLPVKELGIAAVPHGFRSSFRDWAAESTDAPHAVMEAVLAHAVRDRVEAACPPSDLFERRRVLMEQWVAYLAGERRDA